MSEKAGIGFLNAAKRVLAEAGEPLHYRDITQRGLTEGWIVTAGKTPEATMNAQIAANLKKGGEASIFVRTGPGIFGLRQWVADGKILFREESGIRSFIVYFPVYEHARALVPLLDGEQKSDVTGAYSAIFSLSGTPQEPQEWTDPDKWIEERLSGDPQRIALKIWHGTGKLVNPRYMQPIWRLATHHGLVEEDPTGRLHPTARGREFAKEPEGSVTLEIDEIEGLAKLLSLVSELGPSSRSDLLEPFGDFTRSESRLRSDSAIKAALWSRLRNLSRRNLVERAGHSYAITPAGLDYLQKLVGSVEPTLEQQIRRLLAEQKDRVRQEIKEILAEMDPFAFEHLVKRLLEELGYDEVEVTARSGDKGVDVVGRIELGITSVREVIQVKRQKASILRGVLDALRGVLHRFEAVRGTIITTGSFSKGTRDAAFEPGAAPITLIDGERLLDLLTEHRIGVKKKKVELWELDTVAFVGLLPGEEDENEG